MYLYFNSKEEIYLSLLGKYFTEFESDIEQLLDRSTNENFVQALIDAYIKFSKETPKGVYLACIAPLILESNLSDEFVTIFKTGVRDLTMRILQKISHITQDKNLDELRIKFLLSYNLFLGSWQHCHPPTNVKKILESQKLDSILYNFEKEFSKGFKLLWGVSS